MKHDFVTNEKFGLPLNSMCYISDIITGNCLIDLLKKCYSAHTKHWEKIFKWKWFI